MALGISDAVSLSGRVLELVKAGATLELQERIVELREAVLNAKDEILSLREELSTLKCAATEREQLEFDGIVYWRELPDGENEGPFCQRCYDADSKLMRTSAGLILPMSGHARGAKCSSAPGSRPGNRCTGPDRVTHRVTVGPCVSSPWALRLAASLCCGASSLDHSALSGCSSESEG